METVAIATGAIFKHQGPRAWYAVSAGDRTSPSLRLNVPLPSRSRKANLSLRRSGAGVAIVRAHGIKEVFAAFATQWVVAFGRAKPAEAEQTAKGNVNLAGFLN